MLKPSAKWLLLASLVGPGLVFANERTAVGGQDDAIQSGSQSGSGQEGLGGSAGAGQQQDVEQGRGGSSVGQQDDMQKGGRMGGQLGQQPGPQAGLGGAADVGQLGVGEVLGMIHLDNQKEIQLANLAKERAASKEVKQHAERLIKDHQKADQQIQELAKTQNVRIEDLVQQNKMLIEQQRVAQEQITQLQKLSGADFDRQFLTTIVEGHDKTIAMLGQVQQVHANTEVGKFVGKLLPDLKQHRDHAAKLLERVQRAPGGRARRPAGGGVQ